MISASTRGIAAPKGLPDPVVKKLQDVFRKAMMSKDHLDKLESAGQPVKILVGEEAVKYYWEMYSKAPGVLMKNTSLYSATLNFASGSYSGVTGNFTRHLPGWCTMKD